jgi:SPP1 gp7 family putative phage head morphogenesis protein
MGSTTERHRMKVLPRGFKPVFAPTIDERYKNEYDEFIILRISTIFGVAPGAMGVIPRSGLGGSGEHKGQAQTALTTSQKPLEAFLIETINTLSRRFLGSDKNITFAFEDDDSDVAAMTARAQAFQVSVQSGQMTINDVRGELNMPLYDIAEADEPFIVAGQTIQFLNGLLTQSTPNTEEADNGEVVSGTSGASGVTQEGQEGQEGQGPQAPVAQGGPAQGEVAKKSAVTEEVREFARFVKSRHKRGNWRPFEFTTVPESVAEALNEQAYFITKGVTPMPDVVADWAMLEAERLLGDNTKGHAPSITKRAVDDLPAMKQKRAIEDHYADKIAKALGDSLTGVDQAIAIAIKRLGEKAATDPIVAIRGALNFNPQPLTDVLSNVYMDSGFVGTAYAIRELGDGATTETEFAQAASTMNWDTWTPGHPLAASKLAKGGLKTELGNLGYTLKGIGDTTINRMGNAIASGVAQGLPARSIARDINAYVRDSARAMTIATTETNRAYNMAALDQYAASGTKQWEWMAYDDACPDCKELEGEFDITNSQPPPPLHPNCRCSVAAVVSTQ